MPPAETPLRPESVDCHLHAGLERREPFDEVFEYLRADGRETVGLVDHAELYVDAPPPWAALGLTEAAGASGPVSDQARSPGRKRRPRPS